MLRAIVLKELYDRRWFVLWWSIGMAAMIVLTILFFPALKESNLGEVFAQLPPQLASFVGDTSGLTTINGFIGEQLFTIRLPIMVMIIALLLGLGLSTNDEITGRLYQLLAQPISRTRLVLERTAVAVLAITIIHLAMLASIMVGVGIIGEDFSWNAAVSIVIMSWLLTLTVAMLTLAAGFATGKRGFAIATGTIAAFGSFFVTSFASSVDWLEQIDKLSLLHYFHVGTVIKSGFDGGDVMVFVGVASISLLIALIGFRRRDINV